MPNALTNTNISATYQGVLHTNGITIPPTGQETVYDGVGAQSSISLGRTNQGATVTGLLSATDVKAGELRMPNKDGSENQVVARTTAGVLELKSLSAIIGGSSITPGVYDNPRITVAAGGVITKIESRPSIVILDNPVVLIPDYTDPLGLSVNNLPVSPQPAVQNFPITWNTQQGFYADGPVTNSIPAKYAIITVELFIHSGSREFETQMLQDSKIIAKARVDSNDTTNYIYLDNNRYVYRNQQIVKIPTSQESLFQFYIYMNQIVISGRYNQVGRSVTLDGWVF